MTKYQIQVMSSALGRWIPSYSNPHEDHGFDSIAAAAREVHQRLLMQDGFGFRIVALEIGLPSASDLDSVSQEEKVREATGGKQ